MAHILDLPEKRCVGQDLNLGTTKDSALNAAPLTWLGYRRVAVGIAGVYLGFLTDTRSALEKAISGNQNREDRCDARPKDCPRKEDTARLRNRRRGGAEACRVIERDIRSQEGEDHEQGIPRPLLPHTQDDGQQPDDKGKDGIRIGLSHDGNSIHPNIATGNGRDGLRINGGTSDVRYNTVYGNTEHGIHVDGDRNGDDNTVHHNTVCGDTILIGLGATANKVQ